MLESETAQITVHDCNISHGHKGFVAT